MGTPRHRRRLLFGWTAFGSLLFMVADLILVGFPGICGFTGVLLGSFADQHPNFGLACLYAAMLTAVIALSSLILWLVMALLPPPLVDRSE